MSRVTVTVRSIADRNLISRWAHQVPYGTRVEFKAQRRSTDQNSLLWPLLSDIARQLTWDGRRLNTNQWKNLFMDALNHEADLVPSLDGLRRVNVGMSSSDLGKPEFSDLLEIIFAFGAEHGVEFSEPCAVASLPAQTNSGVSAPVPYSEIGAGSSDLPASVATGGEGNASSPVVEI